MSCVLSASRIIRTSVTRSISPLRTAAVIGLQICNSSSHAASSHDSYKSPFTGSTAHRTTNIPHFSKYRASGATKGNQVFGYFIVGTMGALSAAGAKATIQGESYAAVYYSSDSCHISSRKSNCCCRR